MCGRFYVPEDSEIAMLRKVIENLESRNVTVKTGEVSPGDVAAVIASNREMKPQPFGDTTFPMESCCSMPAAKPPRKRPSLQTAWHIAGA